MLFYEIIAFESKCQTDAYGSPRHQQRFDWNSSSSRVYQTHAILCEGSRGLISKSCFTGARGRKCGVRCFVGGRHFISNNSVIGMRDGLLYGDSTSATLIQVPPHIASAKIYGLLYCVINLKSSTYSGCVCCACGIINIHKHARAQRRSTVREQTIVFALSPFVQCDHVVKLISHCAARASQIPCSTLIPRAVLTFQRGVTRGSKFIAPASNLI